MAIDSHADAVPAKMGHEERTSERRRLSDSAVNGGGLHVCVIIVVIVVSISVVTATDTPVHRRQRLASLHSDTAALHGKCHVRHQSAAIGLIYGDIATSIIVRPVTPGISHPRRRDYDDVLQRQRRLFARLSNSIAEPRCRAGRLEVKLDDVTITD